jgi:hypothetical protein
MRFPFRLTAVLMAVGALGLSACGDDDPASPEPPDPPLGLSVQALGSTAIRISFSGRAADDSYTLERSEGSGGTFTTVTTLDAPAADGVVTYDDAGLSPNTQYQYRVRATRGSEQSQFTSAVSGSTTSGQQFARTVTGDITTNTTWYRDTVYTLGGFVHVANGATLTIESGTKIVGDFNTLGASLFILRGAKIIAIGTPDLPIVFTSSRAAGQRQPGDWGGLVLVGNAVISRAGVDIQIEGTGTSTGTAPGTNYTVEYDGGTTNSDDSGELRYVRVEFAGFAPSIDNELNSFSFAAVGSGTRLSYLQAMAGLDDSFEWWGGAADASNLVSYESGDDHYDMSEGYHGRIQNVIALQTTRLTQRTGAGSPSSDPQGLENDGCQGSGCTNGRSTQPYTMPVVANFTLIGTGDVATSGSSGGIGLMLRRGTAGYYVNGILARWPRGAISVRDAETYMRAGDTQTQDLAAHDMAVKNVLLVESSVAFQAGTGQNTLDMAGNAIVSGAGTLEDIFTAFPAAVTGTTTAAAFDWTPKAGSAATTGGLATFTGKLLTAAGTVALGTAYVGAVNPAGPKWFQGWTVYAQQ